MPLFYMADQCEWVELTDGQVALAHMARDDYKRFGDPASHAMLRAVAYERQHPKAASGQ